MYARPVVVRSLTTKLLLLVSLLYAIASHAVAQEQTPETEETVLARFQADLYGSLCHRSPASLVPAADTASFSTHGASRLASMQSSLPSDVTSSGASERPNFLIIVADDLGYTDLGAFGSEIETPNLDALAANGTLLTNFYASPTCSPTRAMLLSGVDNHLAGLGNMGHVIPLVPSQRGQRGYEGHLNFDVAAMPEIFRAAGYRTYMSGKWHLGETPETDPQARGFDRSYAVSHMVAGHFDLLPVIEGPPTFFMEDGVYTDEVPEGFYSTKNFTEKLIGYLEEDRESERPFLAYLAYTAPHWPLQAPEASIAKHAGKYDEGYDVLHQRRHRALVEKGLVPESAEAFPRIAGERAWEALSPQEKREESRRMEIYAAMISDLDDYVGVLINYLIETDQYDNTFIFFMSDNGAEGHDFNRVMTQVGDWSRACCNNAFENWGRGDSYIWLTANWAWASSAPSRMFKGFVSEGGIKVPAIVHYPPLGEGRVDTYSEFATVKDVLPTMMELAGIPHFGSRFADRDVHPLQGKSMVPALKQKVRYVHGPQATFGWELFGKRAYRQGPWKIVHQSEAGGEARWRLYRLDEDPGELNDLSLQFPDKRNELIDQWAAYAKENNVILPDWSNGY